MLSICHWFCSETYKIRLSLCIRWHSCPHTIRTQSEAFAYLVNTRKLRRLNFRSGVHSFEKRHDKLSFRLIGYVRIFLDRSSYSKNYFCQILLLTCAGQCAFWVFFVFFLCFLWFYTSLSVYSIRFSWNVFTYRHIYLYIYYVDFNIQVNVFTINVLLMKPGLWTFSECIYVNNKSLQFQHII